MLDTLTLFWKKVQKPVLYAGILLPFLIFIFYVYKYATDLPRQDDYDAVLGFLTSFKHADFSTRIHLLFMQHNEHRLMPSRLVYAVYYYIFGGMNFRHIILLNAVILTLLFLTIASFVKKALPQYWRTAVFVTSLCLFDLSGFENLNFAMAGVQNIGVILAFTGSIYFYGQKNRLWLIPAVIVQFFCVFSSGNGNLGSALIMLYAILTKDKIKMSTAIIVFLVSAPLYYLDYTKPSGEFITLDPTLVVPFFLSAVGNHFMGINGIIGGAVLVIALVLASPIGKKLTIAPGFLPLLCTGLFTMGSMAVMSIFRAKMPLWCATSSRYHIYSDILTAIAFAFLVYAVRNKERFIKPMIAFLAIGLLLVYNLNLEGGTYGMKAFRTELKTMTYHYPDSTRAKQITDEACKENIYCIEKHRADKLPAIFGNDQEK